MLPNEGETTWDKATDVLMRAEFGNAEQTWGYYVLKRVPDDNRRLQLTWMMERIFLLVKLDYMSRDTFGCIVAAEAGVKVNWAYVLHSRFVMDVRSLDKRKQSGVLKISPFLCRMFEFARDNAWVLCLPKTKGQKAGKTMTGKAKKGVSIIENIDDEPPMKKSKTEDKVQKDRETSKQEEVQTDADILKDMLSLGFKATEVEEGIQQSLGSILKEEMFQISLKDTVPLSASKLEDSVFGKKTLKVNKHKLTMLDVPGSSGDVNKSMFQFSFANQNFYERLDEDRKVSYEEAMRGLDSVMIFF